MSEHIKPTDEMRNLISPFMFFKNRKMMALLDKVDLELDKIPVLEQNLNTSQSRVHYLEFDRLPLVMGELTKSNQNVQLLKEELDELRDSTNSIQVQLNITQEALDKSNHELSQTRDNFNDMEQELNKSTKLLRQTCSQLEEIELRQTLVARLLSANNQNASVIQYFDVLNGDFLEFANEEDSLKDEAAAFLELQSIGDELKVIASYPEFYKKRSVAIAGGFSAGKSEFISSLFEDKSIHLPIGIEPTTAIPTYVLNGNQNGLIGCSKNGGVINLLDIDPNFQHKLSHHFIRSFGFNLKSIMPFVFLTTPMNYQHLCFIDTPGYNPSDVADGHTSEDIKTAEEFVQNAEALLWLIGLDSNGTIAKSDLDFLDNVSRNINKPLYIVLNKSDLRPRDQLEDIMDEIIETLDDYDIEIVGISAYSSIYKEEYTYQKQSLLDFLNDLDTPSDKYRLILQRLHAIDEKYQCAMLKKIKENQQINTILNGFKLDLLQEGFDDLGSNLYEKISQINMLFTSKHDEEMLNKLADVMSKMELAIMDLFGLSHGLQRKVWTLEEVEVSDKFSHLVHKDELSKESNTHSSENGNNTRRVNNIFSLFSSEIFK